MEEEGIGTDATRAEYPSIIVSRGYAERSGGRYAPLPLGRALIEALKGVEKRLVTPETRRTVEEYMGRIERGEVSMGIALRDSIATYRELLERCASSIDVIAHRLATATEDRRVIQKNRAGRRNG
ncbi:DNA topoisomerase 1 [Candidatus Calditenuaceae archaeon HR02]|nr:DNA topoisomerase 1 [Candidatus Calditenuaceae archaeon HR02]